MNYQDRAIKEQLSKDLPYGSNAEIKRRIQVENNRTLSPSMIGNVLNPKKESWDNDVISIALDIAAENVKKRKAIEAKATDLSII